MVVVVHWYKIGKFQSSAQKFTHIL